MNTFEHYEHEFMQTLEEVFSLRNNAGHYNEILI